MNSPRLNVVFGTALILATMATEVAARQMPVPPVTVTVIPGLESAAAQAMDINDRGDLAGAVQVVVGEFINSWGETQKIYGQRAALWIDGQPINLGFLSGDPRSAMSLAFAINEQRQVVGYSTTQTGMAPFSWKDGVMTPLALPAGVAMALPLSINDAGVILGLVSSSPPQSIRWESATSLGQVMETVMVSVNNAGDMAGGLLMDCAPYGAWHAARIQNGQVEHLTAAEDPCRQSLAMAINNAGDMLLYREEIIDDVARIRGALLRNGQETIIEPLTGFGSASPSYHALNDAGDVAFTNSEPTDGGPVWITTGAMWLREGVVALPDLNDADGFDNTMVGPINIHGVAAGTARAADGRMLGVLFHADIDRFAPTVTVTAMPVKPAKGGAPMLFSGRVVDERHGPSSASGVVSATYRLIDEYGLIQPSGTLALSSTGDFSITLPLDQVKGGDKDGRLYTLEITASDRALNSVTSTTSVIVKHGPAK